MGQCVDKVILAGGIFVLVAKCVRPMYGGLAHCGSIKLFNYKDLNPGILCDISACTSWCAESQ